jgi:hypothetical protein
MTKTGQVRPRALSANIAFDFRNKYSFCCNLGIYAPANTPQTNSNIQKNISEKQIERKFIFFSAGAEISFQPDDL